MIQPILFFLLVTSLGIISPVNAVTLTAIDQHIEQASGIKFNYTLHNSDKLLSNTYLSDEAVSLTFDITIANNAIGQLGRLFLVVQHNEQSYIITATAEWQAWDQQVNTLKPFSYKVLESHEEITVFDNQTLAAGEYLLYVGYQLEQDQQIYYNGTPASFIVFDKESPALHQVKNRALLESFFALGSSIQNYGLSAIEIGFPVTSAASDATNSTTAVSQTNLQETDVDESDRIKTDGGHLYSIENCDKDNEKQCITAYSISSAPAESTQLSQLNMDIQSYNQGSLYLTSINGGKHLIHLSDSFTASVTDSWFYPFYWKDHHTDIKFIDINQPEAMQSTTHITVDSSLLSSRLINGVLYLVTRQNAFFNYPDNFGTVDTMETTAMALAEQPSSTSFYMPKNQSIDDLLPTLSFNDGAEKQLLVNASDCFMPSQNSSKPVDNTVITLTAIPLDNPTAHYSNCIVGAIDTFYMSTTSLYLATSRYPYTISAGLISYPDQNTEMNTEIHKFILAEGQLDYRGSGTVQGHLGWSGDKKSFRMGEYNDILKVATSKGNTWNETSTTRVSVLKEADNELKLEEISFLDNLGKPGEQLFAARFIKNRGYLVTFKQTDPLYVLDFSQATQPKILGELEINGYSDYLHPIGENYLLGIGKDAIEDTKSELPFTYYQGLKLSLFDVTDGNSLREVKSMIIGKRGTESNVLYDHHTLAWLASGDSATLAIPVQLNDKALQVEGWDYSKPYLHYDWTHTGLYTFHINTGENPNIELQGKLITNQSSTECNKGSKLAFSIFCFYGQSTYNDRAIIHGDSVHYIHNNAVFSSAIEDLI